MKERQHADERVRLVEVAESFHLAEVGDEVVMCEHHAFW
jgi:hypothetical protein